MTKVGIAKGILAIAGILLFLWAQAGDQQLLRWVAIGLIAAAWMLRFIERGARNPPRSPDPES